MTSSKIVNITKANFEQEVLNSTKPVLLDLWADWCTPCKMIAPTIDQIAEEYDSIKVGKIDLVAEPEFNEAFEVMAIPLLVVINNGKVVARLEGVRPKRDIVAMFENL